MFVLCVVVLYTGCAGHFYREEGDRVHFYLEDRQAKEVFFASSLDGFNLHRIKKSGSGAWFITLQKKQDFQYFYLVDGRIHIPDCTYREKDDFGSYNCLYRASP